MYVYDKTKHKKFPGRIPEVLSQAIETLRTLKSSRLANRLEVWALEVYPEALGGSQNDPE